MKLFIANKDDREAVAVILFRNGYTVRQKKHRPAGAKRAEIILEVEKHDGSAASGGCDQVVPAAADPV